MIFLGQISFFNRNVIRAGDSIWFIFLYQPKVGASQLRALELLLSCLHLQTREASIETMSVREIETLESIPNLVARTEREGPGNESGT